MSNTVIEFNNVGKQYILGTIGTGTLSHDLNRWWANIRGKEDPYLKIGETNDRTQKGDGRFVWALRNINFKVEQGDVVGIVGKNGAGKSTLLKILSRVTSPTTGDIKIKGRIASLLEVGTGFHPEMTGRENIFMNGSIMGMTKAEISSKFDEIVDFAGVAKYVDTPVKRYSSGMMVRLGFAIAAHLEPEILVVDEVLAVGDAEFQKKAIGKMQDVSRGEGRTVLFVSHNMAAVRKLCQRGVLLDNGEINFDGTVDEAIMRYMRRSEPDSVKKIVNHIRWTKPYIHIERILVNGTEDDVSTVKAGQSTLDIQMEGVADIPFLTDLIVEFRSIMDVPLAILAEGSYQGKAISVKEGYFCLKKKVVLPRFLSQGDYVLDIILRQPGSEYQMGARHSVVLHAEGNAVIGGSPLDKGFMGLETMDNDS